MAKKAAAAKAAKTSKTGTQADTQEVIAAESTPPTDAPSTPDPAVTAAADAEQVQDAGAAVADALAGTDDDPVGDEAAVFIHRLEHAGKHSHGAEGDKELMRETAKFIRAVFGFEGVDVAPKPGAYGRVQNAPPIGHSLP